MLVGALISVYMHIIDLTEPRPIDILWTSSYCFLLGVVDAKSGKEMRLVFITALVSTFQA